MNIIIHPTSIASDELVVNFVFLLVYREIILLLPAKCMKNAALM